MPIQDNQTINPCIKQLDSVLLKFGMSDEAERNKIYNFCSQHSFATEETLHRSGEIATNAFFICAGLVRFFYITEDGKEHNKSFSKENQFAGVVQSSVKPEPGRYYIQALEPTRVLALPLLHLNKLYQESLAWANLGRLYMEILALRKTNREAEFLLDSAEQRYKSFVEGEPELVDRLALYHIASYLGITDVALSRIRRRIK